MQKWGERMFSNQQLELSVYIRIVTVMVVFFLLGNSPASEFYMQTPGNSPEESIQHSEHGKSLKRRTVMMLEL
jgi:hypothetical protein